MADDTVTTENPVAQGPALNATTDMPVVEATAPPPEINTEVNEISAKANASETETAEASDGDGADSEDTDTGSETGTNDTAKDAGGDKPNELPAFAKREITKARNQKRDADARAQRLENEANETKAQLSAALKSLEELTKAKAANDTAAATPRPQRENFDSPDAYEFALETWVTDKATQSIEARVLERETARQQEATRKLQDDANKKANQDLAQTWLSKAEKFTKEHPDFVELVQENDDLKVNAAMRQFLFEADNGPEIAYYLGKNPDTAERIAQLSPAKAGIELGKIVASMEAAAKPKVSKAPRPTTPVQSRNAAATKSLDEMSMDEYAAQRMPVLQRERLGPTARARAN